MNGDFFDINNSTAPLGVGIQDGAGHPVAGLGGHLAAVVGDLHRGGVGDIGEVLFQGTVKTPARRPRRSTGSTSPPLKADGIEAFTPLWGTYCRCRATQGATAVTEVEVTNNTVTAVRDTAGEGAIPDGTHDARRPGRRRRRR